MQNANIANFVYYGKTRKAELSCSVECAYFPIRADMSESGFRLLMLNCPFKEGSITCSVCLFNSCLHFRTAVVTKN